MVTQEYVERLRLKPGQKIRVNIGGLVQEASYKGVEDCVVTLSYRAAKHEPRYLFGVPIATEPTGEIVESVERHELRHIKSIGPAPVDDDFRPRKTVFEMQSCW